jgi:hypothetical protein
MQFSLYTEMSYSGSGLPCPTHNQPPIKLEEQIRHKKALLLFSSEKRIQDMATTVQELLMVSGGSHLGEGNEQRQRNAAHC